MKKCKVGTGGTRLPNGANGTNILITPELENKPNTIQSNLKTNTMNTDKNNDIINTILAQRAVTKFEVQAQRELNKTLINNQTWFVDNFPHGIMTIEQFVIETNTASKTQLQSITSLLKIMSDRRKINTSDFPYTDKSGLSYYWIKAYGENGGTEFKIYDFPGLSKLLEGYIWKLYIVDASFEGIYTEAIKER